MDNHICLKIGAVSENKEDFDRNYITVSSLVVLELAKKE